MTPDKEPLMDEDRLVLTEVKTLVGTIREDIHEMREEIRRSNENKVTRSEWLQRNDTVDSRFHEQGADISEIKQEMAAKKSPPAVWISLAVSAAVALWAFFGSIQPDGAPTENGVTVEQNSPLSE